LSGPGNIDLAVSLDQTGITGDAFEDATGAGPASILIDSAASKLGMVRHLEIRYHLVRCIILTGDIVLYYCITEEMLADLFTKIVTAAQDKRLAIRFYNDCVVD
jgi:hypothetical protein